MSVGPVRNWLVCSIYEWDIPGKFQLFAFSFILNGMDVRSVYFIQFNHINTVSGLLAVNKRALKMLNRKFSWRNRRLRHNFNWLTKSMELSPSWESYNGEAPQEFPYSLRNPKVHYHVHKSLPLVAILNQINPVHTIPSYLRSHLFLSLPSGIFLSGFPTKILYKFAFSRACYIPCPAHPPWLGRSSFTWQRVQIIMLLIMQFPPSTYHFIPLRPKYSTQHPVLEHPQPMCLL
jgi:hypothetical protein